MAPELDPRWSWIEVPELGKPPGTQFVKGYCNHLEIVPVTNIDGDEVAQLCTTCDAQFPPSREP